MKKIYLSIALALIASVAQAANPQLGFPELQQNQAQPHITINGADRSITNAVAGQLTINFTTNANFTLGNSQWAYGLIVMTDTGPVLTTGRDVVYPNVDSLTGGTSRLRFAFKNSTAQTLTVKRSGQTGVAVTPGSTVLLQHNGTDLQSISGGAGGTVDLTTGVTGVLPIGNGGTGLSSASDDQTIVSTGSAWVAKTLPSCLDTAGNHLNYNQSTNAFSCGTSGSGGTPGGSTTQVQYNSAGSFAGDADFTFNGTTNTLTIGSTATPGTITGATAGSGSGADLTLRAGDANPSSGTGGEVNIYSGDCNSPVSCNGGNITLFLGDGNGPNDGSFVIRNPADSANLFRVSPLGAITVASNTSGQVLTATGSGGTSWGAITLSNAASVTGVLPWANLAKSPVRTITAAGTITVTTADEIICVNKTTGAATPVSLQSSPATGFVLTVKDCKGDAATNNITMTPNSGNIDGSANYAIITNYGYWRGFYNGTQWYTSVK